MIRRQVSWARQNASTATIRRDKKIAMLAGCGSPLVTCLEGFAANIYRPQTLKKTTEAGLEWLVSTAQPGGRLSCGISGAELLASWLISDICYSLPSPVPEIPNAKETRQIICLGNSSIK